MIKKKQTFTDAIFIITHEKSCPMYNLGDEIKVSNFGLSISSYKPGCLYLSQKITEIVGTTAGVGGFSQFSNKRTQFDCGGCDGLVTFEYKKDKEFATIQMKMLNEAEEKRKRKHLDKFFGVLRGLSIFEPLDDDALTELTLLLELRSIPVDKIVVKKGNPGTHLFIILKGRVSVVGDDGATIAEMGSGEVLGEMSLLSGEPITNSVHTVQATHVAMLSVKNFKQIVIKYPILQIFLFKMLVERAQTMTLQSGNITSGMTGELAEISVVDLLQLIHSAQKTGMMEFFVEKGKAVVCFVEGQIVYASFLQMQNAEALFSILPIKEGHFSYTKGVPNKVEGLSPIGDFMALLMEGVQRIDEQNAHQ